MRKSKRIIKAVLLILIMVGFTTYLFAGDKPKLDSGDTAWMLISSALVLLMVPGLALFYGGMVRSKNVLNTLMLSLVALGVMTIQWMILGYSIAFGDDVGKLFGWNWDFFFLQGITSESISGSIPTLVFVAFQGMFAVITPALISGAIAERVKFGAYVLFIVLWGTFVYDPVCHWVWGGGWIGGLGESLGWMKAGGKEALTALDFAGGTVVHVNAGVAALAVILVLGKRKGYPNDVVSPNNLGLTLLGAGLLWFGWFGFNAGSQLASDGGAGLAFITTFIATAGGSVAWGLAEKWHRGKSSALGFASGIVAGLVAITPACAFVTPFWSLVLGLIAGFVCYSAVVLKGKFGYDDSLDVFGVHGIGGACGALLVGLFATGTGLFLSKDAGSGFHQFVLQIISVGATAIYSFVVTFIIAKVIDVTMGLRVTEEEEEMGLDQAAHGEAGYNV